MNGKNIGILPGKSEVIGHIAPGTVGMPLVEPQVSPAGQHAADDHGRFRAVHEADEPQH